MTHADSTLITSSNLIKYVFLYGPSYNNNCYKQSARHKFCIHEQIDILTTCYS